MPTGAQRTKLEPQGFCFKKMDRFAMAALVDKSIPISLEKMERVIERMYSRYPMIEKHQMAMIIKRTFEVIRERLIIGEILDIGDIGRNMKLFFKRSKGTDVRAMISITSPKEIENG